MLRAGRLQATRGNLLERHRPQIDGLPSVPIRNGRTPAAGLVTNVDSSALVPDGAERRLRAETPAGALCGRSTYTSPSQAEPDRHLDDGTGVEVAAHRSRAAHTNSR